VEQLVRSVCDTKQASWGFTTPLCKGWRERVCVSVSGSSAFILGPDLGLGLHRHSLMRRATRNSEASAPSASRSCTPDGEHSRWKRKLLEGGASPSGGDEELDNLETPHSLGQ
jgi:hypothetical protein